jgi:hypothetical protein
LEITAPECAPLYSSLAAVASVRFQAAFLSRKRKLGSGLSPTYLPNPALPRKPAEIRDFSEIFLEIRD